jgi:hypothetical protein
VIGQEKTNEDGDPRRGNSGGGGNGDRLRHRQWRQNAAGESEDEGGSGCKEVTAHKGQG